MIADLFTLVGIVPVDQRFGDDQSFSYNYLSK
jgi:hypothetical protein